MSEGQPIFYGGACRQCDYLRTSLSDMANTLQILRAEVDAKEMTARFWKDKYYESKD